MDCEYPRNLEEKAANVTTFGDIKISFNKNKTCSVIGFNNNPVNITLNASYKNPATKTNYTLTSIGKFAFDTCDSLISIDIPLSVTSIDDRAFISCNSLTSIKISSNITYIGNQTFNYCKKLSSIIVDKQNTKYEDIESNLFSKNGLNLIQYAVGKTAPTYKIPLSVTSINVGALASCTSLTSIDIPLSVTSIDNFALANCTNLTSVSIQSKSKLKSIGLYVFENCTSLSSITIPFLKSPITIKSLRVNNNSLYDGTRLLYYIGSSVITIPKSVTSIEEGAFNNCRGIKSIINKSSNFKVSKDKFLLYTRDYTKLIYCASESTSTTSLTINPRVTYINSGAFINCHKLKNLSITVDKLLNEVNILPPSLNNLYLLGNFNSTLLNMFLSYTEFNKLYPTVSKPLMTIYYNELNKLSYNSLINNIDKFADVNYKLSIIMGKLIGIS